MEILDEIESMAPQRETSRSDHKKEDVNQLINQLNDMVKHNQAFPEKELVFLAATNLPEDLDKTIWLVI